MSQQEQFLPTFNTAPTYNRLIVLGATAMPVQFMSGPEASLVQHRVALAQHLDSRTYSMDNLSDVSVDSWRQLGRASREWLKTTFTDEGNIADVESLVEAGQQGINTILAFLEIMQPVCDQFQSSNPPRYYYERARASAGFIWEWSGVDGEVDPRLAAALALYEPANMDVVFMNLQFDHSKFYLCPQTQQIKLIPSKVRSLRDMMKQHPSKNQQAANKLYACPAQRLIPRVYRAMNRIALNSGLYEKPAN